MEKSAKSSTYTKKCCIRTLLAAIMPKARVSMSLSIDQDVLNTHNKTVANVTLEEALWQQGMKWKEIIQFLKCVLQVSYKICQRVRETLWFSEDKTFLQESKEENKANLFWYLPFEQATDSNQTHNSTLFSMSWGCFQNKKRELGEVLGNYAEIIWAVLGDAGCLFFFFLV